MKNFLKLTFGEINRLVKYMILPISLVTSVIWIIVFFLISADEAMSLAPLAIFTDVALMSVVLIGAAHHLEKQEGSIKSLFMTPVSIEQILASKIISSMVMALESFVVISAALYFIHGITFNYLLMFVYVVIASCAHAGIGFILSLISFDFSSMLGYLMAYMFVFTIPSILFSFGMIAEKFEWLLFVSPAHSASVLIGSAITGDGELWKIIFALCFLTILSGVLLRFAIYPKFKRGSIRN
jgi:ABC-type multidrug transport system permease subunit